MKHSTTWGKRAVAAAGVAALTLPALAGTAFAEVATGGSIDESKDGASSIQITKYAQDSKLKDAGKEGSDLTGTDADGPKAGTPLAGIEFTGYPVCVDPDGAGTTGVHRIDLKGNVADWDLLAKFGSSGLSAADVHKATDTPAAGSTAPFFRLCTEAEGASFKFKSGANDADSVTDANGVATAKNLKLGLYLVRETGKPADMVISDSTDDFLVSLPLANTGTDKATNPWIYDVKVFPKNTLGDSGSKSIVKQGTVMGDVHTVDDPKTSDKVEGDHIKWQINVPITNPSANSKYLTELQIVDDLDAAFGTAADVRDLVVKKGDTVLTKDTDYKVTPVDSNAQRLQIDFIKTVEKSEPADSTPDAIGVAAGDKVTVEFTTKYVANGQSSNTFTATLKDDEGTPGTVTPPRTDVPVVAEGSFTITKTDKGRSDKKLKDAQFQVCKSNKAPDASDFTGEACVLGKGADDTAGTEDDAVEWLTDATNSAHVFTTGEDGTISGTLKIAEGKAGTVLTKNDDGADPKGESLDDNWAEGRYCAVELQAPKGYTTDTTPHCFTVSSKAGAQAAAVSVTNEQSGKGLVPFLPTTGAQGLVLLTLGGAALAAIAVGSALVIRRRQA